jgi:hypothetical protein
VDGEIISHPRVGNPQFSSFCPAAGPHVRQHPEGQISGTCTEERTRARVCGVPLDCVAASVLEAQAPASARAAREFLCHFSDLKRLYAHVRCGNRWARTRP